MPPSFATTLFLRQHSAPLSDLGYTLTPDGDIILVSIQTNLVAEIGFGPTGTTLTWVYTGEILKGGWGYLVYQLTEFIKGP